MMVVGPEFKGRRPESALRTPARHRARRILVLPAAVVLAACASGCHKPHENGPASVNQQSVEMGGPTQPSEAAPAALGSGASSTAPQ